MNLFFTTQLSFKVSLRLFELTLDLFCYPAHFKFIFFQRFIRKIQVVKNINLSWRGQILDVRHKYKIIHRKYCAER